MGACPRSSIMYLISTSFWKVVQKSFVTYTCVLFGAR